MALVARASVLIAAPRRAVWAALLRPDTILAMMPVTEVVSGWRRGEPFVWKFDLGDQPSHVDGFVHTLEEDRLLAYEYTDPHSRDVLHVENVHRVTIELADEGAGTRVTVVQDENLTPAAQAHAEGGWRLALGNLRRVVEG